MLSLYMQGYAHACIFFLATKLETVTNKIQMLRVAIAIKIACDDVCT